MRLALHEIEQLIVGEAFAACRIIEFLFGHGQDHIRFFHSSPDHNFLYYSNS